VPSSKIYQVLGRLCEKEAVLQIEESGKTLYAAQSPKDLVSVRRSELENTLNGLEAELEAMAGPAMAHYVWNLRQVSDFYNQSRLIIQNCQNELLISAYEPELIALSQNIIAAESRGIRVAIVHFGPSSLQTGSRYYHPIEDTLALEHGGRTFTICADQQVALTATLGLNSSIDGAWSRSSGFVLLAKDYIKHDIYLTKIVARFDQELSQRFGSRYKLLRDIHNDFDFQEDSNDRMD
jgi:sugar-specific transcriptional regulator TrmB